MRIKVVTFREVYTLSLRHSTYMIFKFEKVNIFMDNTATHIILLYSKFNIISSTVHVELIVYSIIVSKIVVLDLKYIFSKIHK